MTQQEKELLLKDLSARLPYGVKVQNQDEGYLDEIQTVEIISRKYREIETNSALGFVDDFKPYLRTLSSMTEEERKEYESFIIHREHINAQGQEWYIACFSFGNVPRLIDWLNKNMFDYRGLIEKCLAIEAPEGMYN